MPVTSTSSDNPPKVDIKVTNGGGGGSDHLVGTFVCWNPAYLDASDPVPNTGVLLRKSDGFCVWSGKNVPSGTNTTFSLTFKRKIGGVTWVLSCTLDPFTGAYSNIDKWEVPANHPMQSSAGGNNRKKKKKKKKKTSKKRPSR